MPYEKMEASFLKSAFRPDQFPLPDRPEIAFAGRSNVGKSSLINRLLNRRNLARTSSRPGRTKSINFFSIEKSLYLADLPGYGYAAVSEELRHSWKKLLEKYLASRSNLKAVVVIIDVRRKLRQEDMDLLNTLRLLHRNPIIVITKIDKLSKNRCCQEIKVVSEQLEKENFNPPFPFSAKTGQGREELWRNIQEIAGLDLKGHTP